ncbi:MAG TPA: lactate dehydrogenase [Candidatus Nitrosotenuis sp.]|nr:lactate dehydrogenase [Candidatus Nitrosotenuis sp.]
MISIIGSGKVGSALAFLCASFGLDDIILINRTEKKAVGEALDITNAIPPSSAISVKGTGDYSEIKDSKVIVITASSGAHIQSRSEIMYGQALMIRGMAKEIAKHAPDSKVLMVTNPVDVMTYLLQKEAGLPPTSVIGVASSLDSARFRYLLSEELGADQSQITDALVLGEHDDSMVPIFSCAKFNGKPVTEIFDEQKKARIASEVRNYWKYLRDYKGHSVFGIARNTFDIVKCIIKNDTLAVPASTLLSGQYGLSDVCVGVPLSINGKGVARINQIKITQDEESSLHKSASIVRGNINKVLEFLQARK